MKELYDDLCSPEGGLKPSAFAACQYFLADRDIQACWGPRNMDFWVISHCNYFCNYPEDHSPAAVSNAGLSSISEQKQTN